MVDPDLPPINPYQSPMAIEATPITRQDARRIHREFSNLHRPNAVAWIVIGGATALGNVMIASGVYERFGEKGIPIIALSTLLAIAVAIATLSTVCALCGIATLTSTSIVALRIGAVSSAGIVLAVLFGAILVLTTIKEPVFPASVCELGFWGLMTEQSFRVWRSAEVLAANDALPER